MLHILTDALKNFRGGITGVLVYLIMSVIVYGIAFMAAFGNDTPGARLMLSLAGIYATIAYPLWGLPLSYLVGGLFIKGSRRGGQLFGWTSE